MTDVATDLVALGADIEWTDATAEQAARSSRDRGAGRLADLVEWVAATQGHCPPRQPRRIRCVVFGPVSSPAPNLAETLAVGMRAVELPDDPTPAEAVEAGVAVADVEVDLGADLVIVGDSAAGLAAAVLVSVLTGIEPVALLPRGADAIDTAAWVGRADDLREARRLAVALRHRPDDLLAVLADPVFAAITGFLLRAAARRTPLVLDGTAVVAAALLVHDTQPRAGRWWQVADASPDPVHARAVAGLSQRPVLDLGMRTSAGVAGLLTVPVLRAAVQRASEPHETVEAK